MQIDLAEIPLRAGFTSKELDAETGLDYFGSRYYDSWAGRFNSIDPHADLYHSWSPYAYSLDNPVLLVDQTGMDPGNNNNQGNQTTSNWNWQYGPNGTYVLFNTGSSNQQQQTLTLAGPQEVPLAPNGFGETQTNTVSRLLSFASTGLDKGADILKGGSAVFIVGGFATGTEEAAAPIGVSLAEGATGADELSFGLKLINYKVYHQGSLSELYSQGSQILLSLMFQEAEFRVKATEVQKAIGNILESAFGAAFIVGTGNNNENGNRLYYAPTDATYRPY